MNPFTLAPYDGPENFCDRQEETNYILKAVRNRRHLTLHSIRRLGKTGLIMHVQNRLPKKYIPVLIDAYDTRSDMELVQKLVSGVVAAINQRKNFVQKSLELFAHFKASLSFNQILGAPSLSIELNSPEEAKTSLQILWGLIKKENKSIFQITIDEFQTIHHYQNSTIDATLREALQTLENVRFIFSGSQRHLLLDLFSNTKKPLFHTTELMELHPIPYREYAKFIKQKFKSHKKKIDDDHIHSILKWTKEHTYYVQYFCHHLFEKARPNVSDEIIKQVQTLIYRQNEPSYYQFRTILASSQWSVLKAIAHENILRSPTAETTLRKYNLGAASTVTSALQALIDKDVAYVKYDTEGKPYYQIYDVFLSRWVAWKNL